MIVIRPPFVIDSKILGQETKVLLEKTKYQKFAELKDIPEKADCLSAVFHLINTSSPKDMNLPLYWIGNAPSRLTKRWSFQAMETDHLKPGDLVFVKNEKATRLVTHVLLAVNDHEVFHCSSKTGKCELLSVQKVSSSYKQPFSIEELLHYIDPRSNSYLESLEINKKGVIT